MPTAAERRAYLDTLADARIAEEAETCRARQEHEQAQAEAAARHNELAIQARAAEGELAKAVESAEAHFTVAVESLRRVHETAARLRRLKARLGEAAVHLSDDAVAARLARRVAAMLRSLPGATLTRYGGLVLPAEVRPAPSWAAAERRILISDEKDLTDANKYDDAPKD